VEAGLLQDRPKEGTGVPVVKITGQGIAAIALSVALLWGCWIATRITMERSLTERARVLHDLQLLQRKHRPEPVSVPETRQQKVHSLLS
jgi:hypothetical protein